MESLSKEPWEDDIVVCISRGVPGFLLINPDDGKQRLEAACDRAWGVIYDQLFSLDHDYSEEPKLQLYKAFERLWLLKQDPVKLPQAVYALMSTSDNRREELFDASASYALRETELRLEELCEGLEVSREPSSRGTMASRLIRYSRGVFIAWFYALDSTAEMTPESVQVGIDTILNDSWPRP